jgi:hypothetical protein
VSGLIKKYIRAILDRAIISNADDRHKFRVNYLSRLPHWVLTKIFESETVFTDNAAMTGVNVINISPDLLGPGSLPEFRLLTGLPSDGIWPSVFSLPEGSHGHQLLHTLAPRFTTTYFTSLEIAELFKKLPAAEGVSDRVVCQNSGTSYIIVPAHLTRAILPAIQHQTSGQRFSFGGIGQNCLTKSISPYADGSVLLQVSSCLTPEPDFSRSLPGNAPYPSQLATYLGFHFDPNCEVPNSTRERMLRHILPRPSAPTKEIRQTVKQAPKPGKSSISPGQVTADSANLSDWMPWTLITSLVFHSIVDITKTLRFNDKSSWGHAANLILNYAKYAMLLGMACFIPAETILGIFSGLLTQWLAPTDHPIRSRGYLKKQALRFLFFVSSNALLAYMNDEETVPLELVQMLVNTFGQALIGEELAHWATTPHPIKVNKSRQRAIKEYNLAATALKKSPAPLKPIAADETTAHADTKPEPKISRPPTRISPHSVTLSKKKRRKSRREKRMSFIGEGTPPHSPMQVQQQASSKDELITQEDIEDQDGSDDEGIFSLESQEESSSVSSPRTLSMGDDEVDRSLPPSPIHAGNTKTATHLHHQVSDSKVISLANFDLSQHKTGDPVVITIQGALARYPKLKRFLTDIQTATIQGIITGGKALKIIELLFNRRKSRHFKPHKSDTDMVATKKEKDAYRQQPNHTLADSSFEIETGPLKGRVLTRHDIRTQKHVFEIAQSFYNYDASAHEYSSKDDFLAWELHDELFFMRNFTVKSLGVATDFDEQDDLLQIYFPSEEALADFFHKNCNLLAYSHKRKIQPEWVLQALAMRCTGYQLDVEEYQQLKKQCSKLFIDIKPGRQLELIMKYLFKFGSRYYEQLRSFMLIPSNINLLNFIFQAHPYVSSQPDVYKPFFDAMINAARPAEKITPNNTYASAYRYLGLFIPLLYQPLLDNLRARINGIMYTDQKQVSAEISCIAINLVSWQFRVLRHTGYKLTNGRSEKGLILFLGEEFGKIMSTFILKHGNRKSHHQPFIKALDGCMNLNCLRTTIYKTLGKNRKILASQQLFPIPAPRQAAYARTGPGLNPC